MRILLVSGQGAGAWYVWRLAQEGHEVEWVCCNEKDSTALSGLIPAPLPAVTKPDSYDLIVFDQTDLGSIAEEARAYAPILGDSKYADRMENDRLFGLELMEQAGIRVPKWEYFDDTGKAIDFVKSNKRRYVLKPCGHGDMDSAATYCAKNDEEMVEYLEHFLPRTKVKEFVLQEFTPGTEVSTEAYFNGESFHAINHTLEEKKLMAGGVGPNTGCAGNILWMANRNTLYERGLAKAEGLLRLAGYIGPLDLNTIVTDGELYGLEWTPRFGYEGTCNLACLLPMGLGDFWHTIASGGEPQLASPKHRYCASIRLSVPPYPNKGRQRAVPVLGLPNDWSHFFLSDLRVGEGGSIETGERDGCLGCPMGVGPTIGAAFDGCEAAIAKLRVPNLQYRTDIRKCVERRYMAIERQGWLRPAGPVS